MRIRDVVLAVAGRIAKYAIVAKSTATGHACAVEGPEREADEPDSQEPARRMQDFGLRSIPPVGSECAVIRSRGGASNAIIIATENLSHGPTDLKEGETSLFCKATGALVKMDMNGKITIDTPDLQDVVVNGGSLKVARDTDPVKSGSINIQVTEVGFPPVRTITILYTDENGVAKPMLTMVFTAGLLTATTPAPGVFTLSEVVGRIKDGAPRFKA